MKTNPKIERLGDALIKAFSNLANTMKQVSVTGKRDVDALWVYYNSLDSFLRQYGKFPSPMKGFFPEMRFIADQVLALIHVRAKDHVSARRIASITRKVIVDGFLKGDPNYYGRFINNERKKKPKGRNPRSHRAKRP